MGPLHFGGLTDLCTYVVYVRIKGQYSGPPAPSGSKKQTLWLAVRITCTPKVCRIMAFWAAFGGVGLLFYLLLGSR